MFMECLLVWAAVTDYHRAGGLHKTKADVWRSGCQRGWVVRALSLLRPRMAVPITEVPPPSKP